MTVMNFDSGGRRLLADLADPLPIAIPLDFNGPQPSFFGAAPARSEPLRSASFVGDTRESGSCNCEQLSLAPHCNGTHTECIGHITDDRVCVAETLRGGMFLSLLLSIRPIPARATAESSDPPPDPDDRLITAAAISAGLASHAASGLSPRALILRTLPNSVERMSHRYTGEAPAPFMTRDAAELLARMAVDHLVLDVPSADRAGDHGRLTAHRAFFGLPPGSRRAQEATRAHASITELAFVAQTIRDGWYLLDLQIPAFLSDAAPSRPILYPVRFA